ncbi:hypothetical protein Afil01_29450 [Actinorhabdospora filicis]|uniref:Uncharacterized protein n=1 Tax=Actinorhabdospora filicis TaxID=1785913 RepID=A0A9W6SKX7_9ACTN|nr:hypothetical protein Afil01_29450 [Actinorhabdospora filicis]
MTHAMVIVVAAPPARKGEGFIAEGHYVAAGSLAPGLGGDLRLRDRPSGHHRDSIARP